MYMGLLIEKKDNSDSNWRCTVRYKPCKRVTVPQKGPRGKHMEDLRTCHVYTDFKSDKYNINAQYTSQWDVLLVQKTCKEGNGRKTQLGELKTLKIEYGPSLNSEGEKLIKAPYGKSSKTLQNQHGRHRTRKAKDDKTHYEDGDHAPNIDQDTPLTAQEERESLGTSHYRGFTTLTSKGGDIKFLTTFGSDLKREQERLTI